MKKQHIVATVGTLALLANLLAPGLAFGQSDSSTANLSVDCGDLSLDIQLGTGRAVDPNFSMTSGLTLKTESQDVFGETFTNNSVAYQDGNSPLPNDSTVKVSDLRGVGQGCAVNGQDEGFVLTVTATDFVGTSAANSNDIIIDNANFYVGTTTNGASDLGSNGVAMSVPAPLRIDSDHTTDVFYSSVSTPNAGEILAPQNVDGDTDPRSSLTSAATFTGLTGNTLDGNVTILDNADGEADDDGFVGEAAIDVAYYGIVNPAHATAPKVRAGDSQSAITYTLTAST